MTRYMFHPYSSSFDFVHQVAAAERQARRSGGKGKKDKRETVQVITKDLIRNLM